MPSQNLSILRLAKKNKLTLLLEETKAFHSRSLRGIETDPTVTLQILADQR